MYNLTIEYENCYEHIDGLTYEQARAIINANLDAYDIWVSICGLPAYSIRDMPTLW